MLNQVVPGRLLEREWILMSLRSVNGLEEDQILGSGVRVALLMSP